MTKERILEVFKNINQMYNNANMYDDLSKMLDELVEDSKKSVEPEKCGDCISRQAVFEKAINIPIAKIVTDDKVICRKVVFVDDIEKLPSVETEQQGRECASCKHSNNGECAYTEECHKCMWESQYERQVEPERKSGKWVHMVGWWECDQCHAEYTDMPTCMGKAIYEYCPMCGAKMEV